MALMIPNGPSFAHWTDNFGPPNSDGLNGTGTAVTPGLSNADGSDTTLLTALAHDCEYLYLSYSGLEVISAGTDNAALMDVLVDPAGGTSWSELITDLNVGWAAAMSLQASNIGLPGCYHFPLWIPAGASVGCRIRFANSAPPTVTPRVTAVAAGGNKNPASWWCGQKVETIGTMDPSNSIGQAVTPRAAVTISGAANNGSGLIRLTVSSTTDFTTGDVISVYGVNGTTEANGIWTVTVISGTTMDLQGSSFANTYSSGSDFAVPAQGSWTNLGSATSGRSGAAQFAVGCGNTAPLNSRAYQYEFGIGGARLGPLFQKSVSQNEQGMQFFSGPIFCDIPAGAQLQVRGVASGVTPASLDCSAYLVQ